MTDPAESCRRKIEKRLTGWVPLQNRIVALTPDHLSLAFPYESDVPIAAVCLNDCVDTLGAACYALGRYREVSAEHRARGAEMAAVFFEVYYLDDVVLRLYSAAEHLANALIMMLGVTDADLAPYQGTASQWEKVRTYLNSARPDQTLTNACNKLRGSHAWRFAMSYRGRWVHNQPPTVAGLGITYRRARPWKQSPDGKTASLSFGGGDPPEHRTVDIGERCLKAFADFLKVLEVVTGEYYQILADCGIKETPGGLSLNIGNRRPRA
jgi:hypothetical protein